MNKNRHIKPRYPIHHPVRKRKIKQGFKTALIVVTCTWLMFHVIYTALTATSIVYILLTILFNVYAALCTLDNRL